MDRIIQFSVPRSGSTLITQILMEMFPDTEVQKVHGYREDWYLYPVVVAVRDFRDCLVSIWRTHQNIPLDKVESSKMIKEEIDLWLGKLLKNIDDLDRITDECSPLILKYEDFVDSHELIFSKIENFFRIDFPGETLVKIAAKTSIENNLKKSLELNRFEQYDHDNLIHGLHIYKKGRPGAWLSLIPKEHHSFVNKKLEKSLKKWGYKI